MIFEAADQGAEYWVTNKLPKALEDFPEKAMKARLAETRMEGYQQKINLFYVMVMPHLSASKHDQLVNCIADFLDALTGGSFGAEARASDPPRARLVYSTAAELVAQLRKTAPRVTITTILFVVGAMIAFLLLLFHPLSKSLPSGWTVI